MPHNKENITQDIKPRKIFKPKVPAQRKILSGEALATLQRSTHDKTTIKNEKQRDRKPMANQTQQEAVGIFAHGLASGGVSSLKSVNIGQSSNVSSSSAGGSAAIAGLKVVEDDGDDPNAKLKVDLLPSMFESQKDSGSMDVDTPAVVMSPNDSFWNTASVGASAMIQFPSIFPLMASLTQLAQSEESAMQVPQELPAGTYPPPATQKAYGKLGEIKVYASGIRVLCVGGLNFDITDGTSPMFTQCLTAVDQSSCTAYAITQSALKYTLTPRLDEILEMEKLNDPGK